MESQAIHRRAQRARRLSRFPARPSAIRYSSGCARAIAGAIQANRTIKGIPPPGNRTRRPALTGPTAGRGPAAWTRPAFDRDSTGETA